MVKLMLQWQNVLVYYKMRKDEHVRTRTSTRSQTGGWYSIIWQPQTDTTGISVSAKVFFSEKKGKTNMKTMAAKENELLLFHSQTRQLVISTWDIQLKGLLEQVKRSHNRLASDTFSCEKDDVLICLLFFRGNHDMKGGMGQNVSLFRHSHCQWAKKLMNMNK